MSIPYDGKYGKASGWKERMVRSIPVQLASLAYHPLTNTGCKRCKKCRLLQEAKAAAQMALLLQLKFRRCRCVFYEGYILTVITQLSVYLQRAMPPGMLQQMQRQMRSGGGMQEMMKAMMQGQGGDPAEMEEMQREFASSISCSEF